MERLLLAQDIEMARTAQPNHPPSLGSTDSLRGTATSQKSNKTWEIVRDGKISESRYRRVQKVFCTQGQKLFQESFAPPTSLFCASATPLRTSARGFFLAGCKTPVAPSPNHFWEFFLFSGNFPGPWLPKTRHPLNARKRKEIPKSKCFKR